MKFQRYTKYLVLKIEDINNLLSRRESDKLLKLSKLILQRRKELGKEQNTYVVVNENEPYAELVWRLIELGVTSPVGTSSREV